LEPGFYNRICRNATLVAAAIFSLIAPLEVRAQQSSVSTWDAADFRVWGFVPYWSGQSGTSVVDQLNILSNTGTYNHVSDVLYFGGVRPNPTGGLWYHSTATQALTTLQNHSAQHGFRLHMSMFDVAPGSTVDATWTSLVTNPSYRATFVDNVTNLLQTYDMSGFNFDWERPNTVEKWGNYTQLARELGDVIRPQGMEISVDDYGFADSRWDDSPLFDARVYDQLFIMGYHYPAQSGNSLNYNSFANGKIALDDQGAEKAFTNEQLAIGVGTWGTGGPATVRLRNFAEANPALGYDVSSVSGTYSDVNGVSRTGTWTIESRQQVREKTQLALDRNMPGMFTWTLHYDAINELGLHRVMHHYAAFQRGIPDLNLDAKVDASDANKLADEMGTVPGWKGTATAAQFDNFYLSGNWEKGDRDGNGFVNQQDADWLADRFTALGVNLPDRLAYSGTFENLQNSRGLTDRWRAKREAGGNLRETGNYAQNGANFLAWSGTGVGATKRSNSFVTLRNQNSAEAFDALNTLPRMMQADLAAPIDTSGSQDTYFTFLVRQNTSSLLASQLASSNRTLALEFLDNSGVNQFDFAFRGLQQEFAIQSQADAAGQDVSAGSFYPSETFLLVGKIAGNGAGTNTLQASLISSGAEVINFADPSFPWMLTAQGSDGFNPVITQLQFTSLFEANYTVSNVWIGTAADLFALPSAAAGDFNADGMVDMSDFVVWRRTLGQTGDSLVADGNGNGRVDDGDYGVWRANFGQTVGSGVGAGSASDATAAVPEPTSGVLACLAVIGMLFASRRIASFRRPG